MSLVQLYLSGSVQRWHMNPVMARTGQTLADHQGRCVLLLLALHPGPSSALIRAVATHDVGEAGAGDLSWTFKVAQPEFAKAHAAYETQVRQAICGLDVMLTQEDSRWLKLVDRLEAACWCLTTMPQEYSRAAGGRERAEEMLLYDAGALGCRDAVHGLLHDLKGGRW